MNEVGNDMGHVRGTPLVYTQGKFYKLYFGPGFVLFWATDRLPLIFHARTGPNLTSHPTPFGVLLVHARHVARGAVTLA